MTGRTGFPGLHHGDARPMPLHPDELAGDAVSAGELGGVLEAGRMVEAAAAAPPANPSAGFTDRVMASLATEPTPSRGGYLGPIRRFGLVGLVGSVRQAWFLLRTGPRPLAVRATALAYVLAVVLVGTSLTGLAAYGVAGAIGLLGPDRSPSPTQPFESPGPLDEPSPARSPESTEVPTTEPTIKPPPSPSPAVSNEPEESDDDDRAPSATPHETDDDDDDATPKPSETPRASRTPSPGETEDSD